MSSKLAKPENMKQNCIQEGCGVTSNTQHT